MNSKLLSLESKSIPPSSTTTYMDSTENLTFLKFIHTTLSLPSFLFFFIGRLSPHYLSPLLTTLKINPLYCSIFNHLKVQRNKGSNDPFLLSDPINLQSKPLLRGKAYEKRKKTYNNSTSHHLFFQNFTLLPLPTTNEDLL